MVGTVKFEARIKIRRREFITLLCGAAAVWPPAVRAQRGERVRRIGVLMNLTADNPVSQARLNVFVQALQQSGWSDGVNVRIDTRWAAADPERFRRSRNSTSRWTTGSRCASRKWTDAVPLLFAIRQHEADRGDPPE
jgi:hypothetical protein